MVASTILLHSRHQSGEYIATSCSATYPTQPSSLQGVHPRACFQTDVMPQHQELSCSCKILARGAAICSFLRETFPIMHGKQAPG